MRGDCCLLVEYYLERKISIPLGMEVRLWDIGGNGGVRVWDR